MRNRLSLGALGRGLLLQVMFGCWNPHSYLIFGMICLAHAAASLVAGPPPAVHGTLLVAPGDKQASVSWQPSAHAQSERHVARNNSHAATCGEPVFRRHEPGNAFHHRPHDALRHHAAARPRGDGHPARAGEPAKPCVSSRW
ncbi:MAG: hypothetical protein L0Z50_20795 [Verrucomicrobiales bacterium]|nr:hypothetical protein [Verrucomicrobiales bacterium]